MSDIFDLLGDSSKKKPKKEASNDDGLDFLGGFKKKVKKGELSTRRKPDTDGITALDIADLPEAEKQIMFMMLRDQTAKKDGLTADDVQDRIQGEEDVHDTLAELAKEKWLLVSGRPPDELYRVNLKRRRSTLSKDIWSALED